MKADFEAAVTAYFRRIAFTDSALSLSKIGYLLLDIAGVSDYTELKLNGSTQSITIEDGSVPVLTEVTITWI